MTKTRNKTAPICLFVYNRPEHLRLTLSSLKNNNLAEESRLIIFSDGPKNIEDEEKVKKVRSLIRREKWCQEVEIFESPTNKGLADSIIYGVTETVDRFGKVIVLEDDLVLAKGFLKYMNDSLRLYENEPRVMHVSGYMFPINQNLPETLFLNIASCWGWGTWQRAWKLLEKNSQKLLDQIKRSGKIAEFNLNGAYDWYHDLKANAEGRMKTWAIRWYASFFLREGYCLHPGKTLVRNIGLDGSGVNCGPSEIFTAQTMTEYITVNKIEINESIVARSAVKKFFYSQNYPTTLARLKIMFKNLILLCRH